jgi:signal transduction histidine kinase
MAPILRDAQRMTLAAMRVVDHAGVVVATTGEDLDLSLAGQDEVVRALAGEPVSMLRQRISRHARPETLGLFERARSLRVFVAQPVLDGDRVVGVVLLSRTPRTLADALKGKRRHLAGLAVLLVVSVAGMVWLGTVAIGRPLRAVTAQAKRTADGERGAVAPLRRPMLREVAELSEALTRMAGTLEQRADYIRDFAAHVSHEFKTPLTTIRGTVELLRDHLDTMAPEERDRFLANMDGEAERLSRLVRRLLDLARADVMGGADGGTCRPAEVAGELAARYRAMGLKVEVAPATDGAAAIGRDALETILANLLDNSRQHAGSDAKVTIAIGRYGDGMLIRVADNGRGISPGNAERIFTPFFTTARQHGGTGLGLAIVHTLVSAHGGTIVAVPSESGAVFEIHFAGADRS